MVTRDSEILAKILSMTHEERDEFMSRLKPDTLAYLENLLYKAEIGVNTTKLQRYLKSKKH